MRRIRRALARVGATLGGRRAADDELRREMEAHLEMEIEANLRRGLPPDEARRQALIAAGGLAQAAESVREERGLPWIENLVADLRYATRHFGRTPLATLTMILVLSLGIGTNVVLFTVLSSLATLPAPGIARDASLVRIRGTLGVEGTGNLQERLLSWPEVEYAGRTDLGLLLGLPLSIVVARQVAAALRWPLTSSPLLGVAIGAVVLAVGSLAAWLPRGAPARSIRSCACGRSERTAAAGSVGAETGGVAGRPPPSDDLADHWQMQSQVQVLWSTQTRKQPGQLHPCRHSKIVHPGSDGQLGQKVVCPSQVTWPC